MPYKVFDSFLDIQALKLRYKYWHEWREIENWFTHNGDKNFAYTSWNFFYEW